MAEFDNYMPLRRMVQKIKLPFNFQFLHSFKKMTALKFENEVLFYKNEKGEEKMILLDYSKENICILYTP